MSRFATTISVLCVLACAVTMQAKSTTDANVLAGSWNCIAQDGPNGDIPFTLYFEKSSEGYTGSVSAQQGDTDLTSVTFENNHLKVDINTYDNDYKLNGTLANGKLSGTWYLNGKKQGPWSGKK